MPMNLAPKLSRKWLAPVVAGLLCLAAASPALAADEADAPKGAAVTVLKAAKSCFAAIVEVSGIVIAREETMVRPERQGLKVAEILADAGDTVTAGQTLARLTLPEGGLAQVSGPGGRADRQFLGGDRRHRVGQGRGAVFDHRAQRIRPGRHGADREYRQARGQPDGQDQGHRRRRGRRQDPPGRRPTVEPNSQLGQVFIGVTTNRRLLVNSSGRALITTGQSCNIAVPLTAILYGSAGTVVQVVRRERVETKQVEIGLMSGGQVEIRERPRRRRHRGGARRRAAARRRSGAAGDGGRESRRRGGSFLHGEEALLRRLEP